MDSAIQRMNCRDISQSWQDSTEKGRGDRGGKERDSSSFSSPPPPAPLPLSCAWHALLQGKWVLATYRWGKPGRTSIPSRGFGGGMR